MWNLLEKRDLLKGLSLDGMTYDSHSHLAEMIALSGPPPKALIDQLAEAKMWKWNPEIENARRELATMQASSLADLSLTNRVMIPMRSEVTTST